MSIYKQNAISRKYLSHTQLFVTGATSRYALTARHLPPNPSPNPPRICPPHNASYPPGNLPPISDTGTPRIPVTKIPHPLIPLPISLQIMT